ncbi:MAG: sugar phosphate isomerase/epimerase [Oscillospiraceae bacterium]|jgi:sugar phosphate isomerase/epimerase|nr:sugar phosphate isomerase/epimerase [Oscillospiraceae bacterium]
MKIGAQLYTVRDLCRSPEGLRSTLERVAGMGYEFLQLSGFVFDAAETKALCDALGLRVMLTHTPPNRILNDTAAVIAEHKIMGCPYVGVGGFPGERSPEGVRGFLRDYLPAMRTFAEAGLKFQYHNHSFEFQRFDGGSLWDILVSESDPALLGFTLDVYWVQHAGKDIADLIRSLKGRIDVCHYKDMAVVGGQQRFAAIGQGNFDWNKITAAFEEAGAQYAFVEQDDCYGLDPLEELESSLRFLRGSRLF